MAEEEKNAEEAEEKKSDAGGENGEDPSMEDILKSIRGVIAGDEAAAGDGADSDDEEILELTEMAEEETPNEEVKEEAAAEEPAAEEEAKAEEGEDDKSVLDNIDEALEEEKAEEPAAEEEKAEEPAAEEAPAEEEKAEEPAAEEAPAEEAPAEEEKAEEPAAEEEKAEEPAEAAAEADEAAESDSERLLKEKVADESSETLKTLVANLPKTQIDSPYTAGGITLEQLTIEAMRPFLAEWLNENLPVIVKQIVTKEIKKLIPEEDDK